MMYQMGVYCRLSKDERELIADIIRENTDLKL